MGTVCHWQPFCSQQRVAFIGQCWYFNPQWTPVQAVNEASSVWTLLVSWDKMHSSYVFLYKSGFVEGFRRWRGYIVAPQRKPNHQGSCIIASDWILLDRSEQTSTHCLQHLHKLFGILKGSLHAIFRLQRANEYIHTPNVLFCFLLTVQLFGQIKHCLLHLAWWTHCLCFSSVSSQLKNVQICLKKKTQAWAP